MSNASWLTALVLMACSLKPLPYVPRVELAPATRAAPEVGTTLGTADPLLVKDVAPDGGWLVACQARVDTNGDGRVSFTVGNHGDPEGDNVFPWLVVGQGAGEPIDELIDSDESGRYVVYLRSNTLVLHDTVSSRVEFLAERVSDIPVDQRRSLASFARARLLHVAWKGPSLVLKVRSLDNGESRELPTGAGRWSLAWITPGGDSVYLDRVEQDDDHDGKLQAGLANSTRGTHPCAGSPQSYSTFGTKSGDKPRHLLVSLDGKEVERAKGSLAVKGGLVTQSDGVHWAYVPFDGAPVPLTLGGVCSGDLLAVDGESATALVRSCDETFIVQPLRGLRYRLREKPLNSRGVERRIIAAVDGKRLYAWDLSNRERFDVERSGTWEVVSDWADGFVVSGNEQLVAVMREASGRWRTQTWPASDSVRRLPSNVFLLGQDRIASFDGAVPTAANGRVHATRGERVLVTPAWGEGSLGPASWR